MHRTGSTYVCNSLHSGASEQRAFTHSWNIGQITKVSSDTSEYVAKAPFGTMQILGHKLLCWRLTAHILTMKPKQRSSLPLKQQLANVQRQQQQHHQVSKSRLRKLTSCGRHSSAWRRSTEKPPCVLVSEAVNVLQKECTRGLAGAAGGAAGISSSLEPFSSGCYMRNKWTDDAWL
jgi:hypothetical protein